jgi:hypothetical protein
MKNTEASYINAGYRLEQTIIHGKPETAIIARMQSIRVMLQSEAIGEQEEARRLVERGRQEARSETHR